MEFGKRLSQARNAKGLTQAKMAEILGMTLQAYQNFEYNKRDMKGSMIIRVCALLECSSDWLLGIKDTGAALPPESEVMRNLRKRVEELDAKGQRKVLEYADDIVECGKHKRGDRGMQDDTVSRSA